MNFYRDESSDAKYNAQRNLSGRSHYVDDDTLRFFHARILSSGVTAGGLLFWLIESVALDDKNRSRGYRFAVFDLFGEVLERPDLEHSFSSSKAAMNALRKWLADFDAKHHTLQAAARSLANYQQEINDLERKLLSGSFAGRDLR